MNDDEEYDVDSGWHAAAGDADIAFERKGLLEPEDSLERECSEWRSPCDGALQVGSVASEWSAPVLEAGLRRFVVRCKGAWRVRARPSLAAEPVGVLPSGTVLCGAYVEGLDARDDPEFRCMYGDALPRADRAEPAPDLAVAGLLWVRIVRLEESPGSAAQVRLCLSAGSPVYCLSRNSQGLGLQELRDGATGPVRPREPCCREPRRKAAPRATVPDDVSLTWKMLGHLDGLTQLLAQMVVPGGGGSEALRPRRRPEDAFERRRREALRQAARGLRRRLCELIRAAQDVGGADAAGRALPPELARRLAGLSAELAASAACTEASAVGGGGLVGAKAVGLLAEATLEEEEEEEDGLANEHRSANEGPATATLEQGSAEATATEEPGSGGGAVEAAPPPEAHGEAEGAAGPEIAAAWVGSESPADAGAEARLDLPLLARLCHRLERTGGWPGLKRELEQEVTLLDQRLAAELQRRCRQAGSLGHWVASTPRTAGAPRPSQTPRPDQGGNPGAALPLFGPGNPQASPAAPGVGAKKTSAPRPCSPGPGLSPDLEDLLPDWEPMPSEKSAAPVNLGAQRTASCGFGMSLL